MRDEFPVSVKDILAKRVGYRCTNPDCRQLTCGPQDDPFKAVNVGVAAHITAASPDGSRYDSSLTSNERKEASNGIWLCQTCAKLVDNDPLRYTVKKLYNWKSKAEEAAIREIEGEVKISEQENRDTLQKLEEQFPAIASRLGLDHHVVEAHSERAERKLNLLIKQRSLTPDKVRQELISFVERVCVGDLIHAETSIRARILYWAARVHASQSETIPLARSYLKQLHDIAPDFDMRIIEALILETESSIDSALKILRDIDTSDGRATLFIVLFRTQGEKSALEWFDDQPDRNNLSFFTGIGWVNVAISLAKMVRWEEAGEFLDAAQKLRNEWPDLAFVDGVINAAMLLPVELRPHALEMNVFHPEIRPIEGIDADRLRARAKASFEDAEKLLKNIEQHGRAQAAKDWLLWLKLTHPDPKIVEMARIEVQEGMKQGRKAVDLILFARTFKIDFDQSLLQHYLMERRRMGGLGNQELAAELFLAEIRMDPKDFAAFMEREETQFSQIIPKGSLVGKRIEALVRAGQIARARNLLEEHKNSFIDHDYERLRAMIDTREGSDPRERLEDLYQETGSLIDLKNLIDHIGHTGDWKALQPHLEELFAIERTAENALRLVDCMYRNPIIDYPNIIHFFEKNQDIVVRSLDLASAKAWALSHTGRLKEAESINRGLLEQRDNQNDVELDINLALQSGDWERFPVIIDREWPRREELEPALLMRLASLAAETDTVSRALELAKLAVSKASDDPEILISAYALAVQLGHEEQAEARWITRASELSSEGRPVRQVDLRTIVEEVLPAQRERIHKTEEALLAGAIPLYVAAQNLNQPLSRFLIDIPYKNAEQQDGRKRTIVPITSGARQTIDVNPKWTVGFDVTSLMVLSTLGLLSTIINAFKVVLAPDTMILLLNERRRARFHQPSLIEEAEEIRSLIDQQQLKTIQNLPNPPIWLVDEVGRDLAEILEAARLADGRVLRPYPIHKLKTFMDREAELQDYANLILSTKAFAKLLFKKGFIDTHEYELACNSILIHDSDRHEDADSLLLNHPLYIDELALTYLQKANLLQRACNCRLELFVHPLTKSYQTALIEENREGNRLAEILNDIQLTLRNALDTGQAIFLPRHGLEEDDPKFGWLYQVAPTLAQILKDARPCDIICVDDRFVNRHRQITDEAGRSVPLMCVLDLLQYLEKHGTISTKEKYRTLHKLRQSGYILVPIEPDELEMHLRHAKFDQDGHLIESAEMRIIRQTFMRIRSLGLVILPTEAPFLDRIQLGCILVIRRLWKDEALALENIVTLSDWVWRNLAPSPLDWIRISRDSLPNYDISEAFARHLSLLLKPMSLKKARHTAFSNWVEREILEPLLPANVDLVDRLAEIVSKDIESLSDGLSKNEIGTDS